MRNLFSVHKNDAVIHFTGLKTVGEPEAEPLKYYNDNVSGSVLLSKINNLKANETWLKPI